MPVPPIPSGLALFALTLLLVAATTLWTRDAPRLYDHALIPGLALLAVIALETVHYGPLLREFWEAGITCCH